MCISAPVKGSTEGVPSSVVAAITCVVNVLLIITLVEIYLASSDNSESVEHFHSEHPESASSRRSSLTKTVMVNAFWQRLCSKY